MESKRITTMYKQKKFFSSVFDSEIQKMGNLKDNQHIRVFQAKDDYSKVTFFTNIDDLVEYVSNKNYHLNTYFTLSTTTGTGGTEQDLINRTVLAWDFDKKDLGENFTFKDLIDRFKSIGLWYHTLIDSGNGYHAYTYIEPTKDINKVVEVTKAIGQRLGADINAMKSTQILRVPYTFNAKDKPKQVNIINMFNSDTIKRYSIETLHNKYCGIKSLENKGNRVTQFSIRNTNIPVCIEEILFKGSVETERYEDLKKIVVTLRNRNKTLNEIKKVAEEWNYKSNYNDNLMYRVEHIFNNLKYISMKCRGCEHSNNCFNRVDSNFNYPDNFSLLSMTETHTSKLRASNRKGAKVMKSNDILIYGILKNNNRGLYRAEIIEELTYKDKVCLSEKPLTQALKNLEDNGFIEVEGKPKFYKLKDIRSKIELNYNISYAATYEAVKGNISTEELKLYNYMRYLHNKQQREDSKALKGNLFQFNQVDLAKDMGLTQQRISAMINNLIDEKLLGIWYRQPSKNNGFDYNVYRLNY